MLIRKPRMELMSCPFCGSDKVKLRRNNRTVINGETERNTYCYCTVCDCRSGRILYKDYNEKQDAENMAITIWNRRR